MLVQGELQSSGYGTLKLRRGIIHGVGWVATVEDILENRSFCRDSARSRSLCDENT